MEQGEYVTDEGVINILNCNACDSVFCSTCGIDQNNHGLTLTTAKVQYANYKNALRKLKYVKDGD